MSGTAAPPLPGRTALRSGVLGLRSWIWRKNGGSLLMLVAFPGLLGVVTWVLSHAFIIIVADDPAPSLWVAGNETFLMAMPVVLVGTGLWFLIAMAIQQPAILSLTSATLDATSPEARRVRRVLEPLAISRGLPTPQVAIIPSPGLNAFATGWSDRGAVIGVTKGLIDTLDDDELEAVVAHELSHIINRDTRLLIISIVFVGVFALASELTMRMMRGSGRSNGKKAGQMMLFLLVATIVLWIGRIGAMGLRFAISRKREFMADAGAVELTKKPEALVSALTKISASPEVAEVSDEVQQMFIFDPPDLWEMFSTHPSMDDRIAAIRAVG